MPCGSAFRPVFHNDRLGLRVDGIDRQRTRVGPQVACRALHPAAPEGQGPGFRVTRQVDDRDVKRVVAVNQAAQTVFQQRNHRNEPRNVEQRGFLILDLGRAVQAQVGIVDSDGQLCFVEEVEPFDSQSIQGRGDDVYVQLCDACRGVDCDCRGIIQHDVAVFVDDLVRNVHVLSGPVEVRLFDLHERRGAGFFQAIKFAGLECGKAREIDAPDLAVSCDDVQFQGLVLGLRQVEIGVQVGHCRGRAFVESHGDHIRAYRDAVQDGCVDAARAVGHADESGRGDGVVFVRRQQQGFHRIAAARDFEFQDRSQPFEREDQFVGCRVGGPWLRGDQRIVTVVKVVAVLRAQIPERNCEDAAVIGVLDVGREGVENLRSRSDVGREFFGCAVVSRLGGSASVEQGHLVPVVPAGYKRAVADVDAGARFGCGRWVDAGPRVFSGEFDADFVARCRAVGILFLDAVGTSGYRCHGSDNR